MHTIYFHYTIYCECIHQCIAVNFRVHRELTAQKIQILHVCTRTLTVQVIVRVTFVLNNCQST